MKTISRLFIALAFMVQWVFVGAQPASADFAPTTEENSLLWEITGKELVTPSYLFGTIHMIPKEHYVLTDVTAKALDAATEVAFEIDTEEMMNPAAMMGLLTQMYMANDTVLSDLMSEEDYTLVSAHFEEVGLPLMFLKRIKPMFLSVLASEDMQDFDMSNGGMEMSGDIKSYEMELTAMAKEQEKPIAGLETAEFQMSLFDSIPYKAQADMLLEAIKSEESTEEDGTFDRMIELYVNQDIVGMQSMMSDDPAGIGGYEEVLLLKRNRNWIPVMAEMMADASVFFAVGAGHLAGDEGVIALLRAEGYTVKPVR